MKETDEFNLLTGFLDVFEPTVEPREAAPMQEDDRKLLERIASGDSSGDDLARALLMLCGSSTAMEYFAHQLNAG